MKGQSLQSSPQQITNKRKTDTFIHRRTKFSTIVKYFVKKIIGLTMLISPPYYYAEASKYVTNIGKHLSQETFSEMFMLTIYLSAAIIWFFIGFKLLLSKKS